MDDKQKKIGQLRALLGQANTKIKGLKQSLLDKDKQIQQIKAEYQKKLKSMHSDEGLIMKQYQERLIRIQKSLQDSEAVVSKYKKLHQEGSKSYELLINEMTQIAGMIGKNFAPFMSKDNNEAVQELCAIEKCRDFEEKMDRIEESGISALAQLVKGIKKLSGFYVESLNKKRELRMLYLKKEASFQKQLQDQEQRHSSSNSEIEGLNKEIKEMQEKYEKKIETIAKSKAKMSEQKTNLEFIKQLLIKVVMGPKQASLMGLQVLSKVLKFTPQQYSSTQKKIK